MAWIYKITSPSKKVYVGSTVNIKARWRSYRALCCKHQSKLYRSFVKYGVKAHTFEIITECTEEEMYRLEATYGHLYNVLGKKGLNCSLPKNGEFYHAKSDVTKARLSLASIGRKLSEEHKAKLRRAGKGNTNMLGRKLSEVTKAKLRLANIGRKHTEETKAKISKANKGKTIGMLGKKHSEETKAKMSLTQIGRKLTKEHKAKLGLARTGRKLTQETKAKMSLSKKGNTNALGKKFSEETKQRLRESHKRNHLYIKKGKLVLDTETGIYYDSGKEAALAKNINPGTIRCILNPNHSHNNKTSLIYV